MKARKKADEKNTLKNKKVKQRKSDDEDSTSRERLGKKDAGKVNNNVEKKCQWPETTQQQEENAGTMGENQYGGRKQKRSNDVAFLNEMIL